MNQFKFIISGILTLLFFSTCIIAQPLNKSTYTTMIQTAEEANANNDYYNALEWYEKAYDERRDRDLIPAIAELHFKLRDYRKAENYYRRMFRPRRGKEPDIEPQVRYQYGRILKMNGDYDQAIEHLQKVVNQTTDEQLKELAEYALTGAEMAKVLRPVPRLRIDHAGNTINSRFSEYSAYLAPSGDKMYYGGFNTNEVIIVDEKNTDYFAKIYTSVKEGEDWGKPTALSEKINRPGFHTANLSLSKDGRRMYFTRQQLQGNALSESKIFMSEKAGEEWGPAKEVLGVNGNWLANHPAVGELFGNEVLFFVADMPGTQGGMDIFYATYKGDGVYGEPVNLGPKINTPADEETPFFRDGNLYFSSTGHPGIGGYDIFSSTWNGATWSEPKNMGLGYNSNLDDKYFMIDKAGFHGFIISNRQGTKSTHGRTCCDDIWEFTIEKLEIDAIVGTFDAESGDPLFDVTVQLFAKADNQMKPIDESTNPEGNVVLFPLLSDKSYFLIAQKQGYYPDTSEVFNTVGITESKRFEQRLRLRPQPPEPASEEIEVTINQPIRLNNIYYDFDEAKILPDAEEDLSVLLDLMNEYPEMKIELSSHTDARGNDQYNEALSQRRAESAKNWLVKRGISADRIVAKGYGETQILNECTNGVKCTDIEHRFNRRTEFKIIEGPTTVTIKTTEKKSEIKKKSVPKGMKKMNRPTTPEKSSDRQRGIKNKRRNR